MFPKHKTSPNPENPFLQELQQKQIGFSPLVFCEFFQGMEVLQIYGEESKEYLFAIYFSGKLVGHVYYGQKYSDAELAILKKKYFPTHLGSDFRICKKNFRDLVFKIRSVAICFCFAVTKCFRKSINKSRQLLSLHLQLIYE